MKVNWPIATLVLALSCGAVVWAVFSTNSSTSNEEASLTSTPSNSVSVKRMSASEIIDRERPRANELDLAIEFKILRTEIASINERLLKMEGDIAANDIEDSLALEEAGRIETKMTEDDETEILEQLSGWDDEFGDAIENAWSNDLQIGIEKAIDNDDELAKAITSVGCRSTLCRFDMEQGAKTAYTFTRLIQKQPNLSQMIQRSVSFKKRDGTTVFFLDFEEQ